ncbi:hypothetical protein QMK19_37040 [Streptomyces sp. H10-C2]|uniref:hypothetical protein n=1 Tax=unclassified Streptomyces TaxID=2593676 RepID=UPI0024BB5480|nr:MULTISPECIES: hypothetical protein [unclassified Streptomyces]MDJ0347332.1 hypothetical protein [Streptomyces sp. PH10-H1]MDJ0375071.1 hypothetical protein [Streptomyces sp. H10-C2]
MTERPRTGEEPKRRRTTEPELGTRWQQHAAKGLGGVPTAGADMLVAQLEAGAVAGAHLGL